MAASIPTAATSQRYFPSRRPPAGAYKVSANMTPKGGDLRDWLAGRGCFSARAAPPASPWPSCLLSQVEPVVVSDLALERDTRRVRIMRLLTPPRLLHANTRSFAGLAAGVAPARAIRVVRRRDHIASAARRVSVAAQPGLLVMNADYSAQRPVNTTAVRQDLSSGSPVSFRIARRPDTFSQPASGFVEGEKALNAVALR